MTAQSYIECVQSVGIKSWLSPFIKHMKYWSHKGFRGPSKGSTKTSHATQAMIRRLRKCWPLLQGMWNINYLMEFCGVLMRPLSGMLHTILIFIFMNLYISIRDAEGCSLCWFMGWTSDISPIVWVELIKELEVILLKHLIFWGGIVRIMLRRYFL